MTYNGKNDTLKFKHYITLITLTYKSASLAQWVESRLAVREAAGSTPGADTWVWTTFPKSVV